MFEKKPSKEEQTAALNAHLLNVLMLELAEHGYAPNGIFMIDETKMRAAGSKNLRVDFYPKDGAIRLWQTEK